MKVPTASRSLDRQTLLNILRFLTEVAEVPPESDRTMDLVCRGLQTLCRAEGSALELLEGENLVCVAATGVAADQVGARARRPESRSGLWEGAVAARALLWGEPSEGTIALPLNHRGRSIGLLKVIDRRPGSHPDRSSSILESLAGTVASALAGLAQGGGDLSSQALFLRGSCDALTGLDNRPYFLDQLRRAILQSRRYGGRLGVVLVRLEDLRRIEDRLGPPAGDEALRTFARRLREGSRDSDVVARVGGDQFALLLHFLDTRESVTHVASHIAEELARPFLYEGRKHPLCAKVGYAVYPEDGPDTESLVRFAEESLSEAQDPRGVGTRVGNVE